MLAWACHHLTKYWTIDPLLSSIQTEQERSALSEENKLSLPLGPGHTPNSPGNRFLGIIKFIIKENKSKRIKHDVAWS